jgi:hypothetical protein
VRQLLRSFIDLRAKRLTEVLQFKHFISPLLLLSTGPNEDDAPTLVLVKPIVVVEDDLERDDFFLVGIIADEEVPVFCWKESRELGADVERGDIPSNLVVSERARPGGGGR